ncbi:MAG TPA: hypothetical protein VMY88_10900 [Acidimicrobiales bacterium]|nr:hypothetical protein [Acidimicrobiales bacterium]
MTQAVATKILAALIALQVGVGGVALATVEDAAATGQTGGAATTTTIPGGATLPDGTPAPGDPGAVAGVPAPGQPGAAPAPGGATPPPPLTADLNSLPERPTPPRPGAYTYRTKFDGHASAGTFTTQVQDESDSTFRYESAPPANGETRDREKSESSGSSGGFDFSGNADRERSWRQNGMFITAESGGGGGGGESFNASCDWEPDVQDLAFPLKQGATWTWNSTCESRSENFDSNQSWRGEARVTGQQTASVGGREIRVLVIERKSERVVDFTMRRDGRETKGKSTIQETTRQLYAPSVALTVRTDTDLKGAFESPGQPGGSGQFQGKAESELRSLDPK